jgi:RNA polymerase sigma-54 factor
MQMAQKQVLAPRMIQSMEILQLPIIALQERIEQEMEDNPVLDQVEPTGEEEEGGFEETAVAEPSPDAPEETERELIVDETNNNEDDFERLINMAENLPDEYEERSRPSRGQIEAEGDRRHDQMANMIACRTTWIIS